MKIVAMNGGSVGSTGKIMIGIAELARGKGIDYTCAYPIIKANRGKPIGEKEIQIGNYYSRCFSVLLSRVTGQNGCFAYGETKRFLKKLDKLSPDILHLHNLHDSYIHLPSLFAYIKKKNIRVVWTLHDCWAFTGHCAYFDIANCDKWKTGCYACPEYKRYPNSYVDSSKGLYQKKKKWFTGVKDMTIVCPSKWLAELVKQSFLNEYPVEVVHNGIDLSVFTPTESDFREKYALQDKKIVLGVAFGWGRRKGFDIFLDLAKRLDKSYQIVLIGTDENTRKCLPENVVAIDRTSSQSALAEIYTAADVFVNPTREDNFPTVNMEALACGTPVITFNTGGSPESVGADCGAVVEKEDIDGLQKEIERICVEKPYTAEACIAQAKKFDKDEKLTEYLAFYR